MTPPQLFPDMPLPPLGPDGGSPALPAGDTSGVMPGLDSALIALLRNYRPGDIGICELADKIQLSLPVPEWAWYSAPESATSGSITGGAAATLTIYTVPGNIRCMLEGVILERATGDNNLHNLYLLQPPGYFVGNSTMVAKRLTTPGVFMTWPDDTNAFQAADFYMAGPILLEPGTQIQLTTAGDGVSASTFAYQIAMRHTKLVRAAPP